MARLNSLIHSCLTTCTDEYDVVDGYLPSFVQHLKDTGARFGLGATLHDSESDAHSTAEEGPAASSWTSVEQDAFFRAVSVHSRWRPDLIAACIPAKTEWEVSTYLEALEGGVATLAMRQAGEDADTNRGSGDDRRWPVISADGSLSDSDSDTETDELVCEPALEVSQAWIDVEERMASWITQEEHLIAVGRDTVVDAEDANAATRKRKRGRPRVTGTGRTRNRARAGFDNGHQSDRSPSSERPLKSARKKSRGSLCTEEKRAELMGHLEAPHLLVLDGILREEGEEGKSKSREESVPGVTLTKHRHRGKPCARDIEVPNSSGRMIAPQGTNSVCESSCNMVIDPVLLALSGHVDCIPSEDPTHASTPSSLHRASSQPPSFSPRGPVVFTPTTHTHPGPALNAEADLTLFSPRSRRRIQKRLYMRRKRAISHENSEGDLTTAILEKLKPGKRAKSQLRDTPAVSVCTKPPLEAEEVMEVRKKSRAGLTLPYKLKAQFAELGVDAGYLCSRGMDLLNLGALGKLMGLCSSLEEQEDEETGRCLDAQLIQYLQAAMVSFVTDIIHRAIVWKERDIRLKQRSQAWRQRDHITIGVIEHAVAAVGARYRTHKDYFESLGLFPSAGNVTEVPDRAKAASVDADVEATGLSTALPRLSLHRDVYMPLIRLPSEWRGMGVLGGLTCTYEQEAARTRRGPSAEADEELMSDETDEGALADELAEEAKVDEEDMTLATTYEAQLWNGLRK